MAILGPRQIEKTTLAFAIGKKLPSIYLDLEDPEDFQKLSNTRNYLNLHKDKLIIIDEKTVLDITRVANIEKVIFYTKEFILEDSNLV